MANTVVWCDSFPCRRHYKIDHFDASPRTCAGTILGIKAAVRRFGFPCLPFGSRRTCTSSDDMLANKFFSPFAFLGVLVVAVSGAPAPAPAPATTTADLDTNVAGFGIGDILNLLGLGLVTQIDVFISVGRPDTFAILLIY
ncbi:hypothetical protein OF83DRAFT_359891 [Amylostereum chailletii]|nr:hypothetical protein OF83DRAFT_359891 [Amylostereum chailletii]